MQTIEFFSGSGSFSKVMQDEFNFAICTIDNIAEYEPSFVHNMLEPLTPEIQEILERSSLVWISFPCETFSIAAGNRHWTANRTPRTNNAIIGLSLLEISQQIKQFCIENNKAYVMENPRGRAGWFSSENDRYTIWYCQYGSKFAKPTHIWTNIKGFEPKICKNNNKLCHHQKAPRGFFGGINGTTTAYNRSKVPRKLIIELTNLYLENGIKETNSWE